MLERYSERARQVVVFAHAEALRLKHDYIGTEHLLLGLLRADDGIPTHVLETTVGITLDSVREQVARTIGVGDDITDGELPFTPRAKRVLDEAVLVARSLGRDTVEAQHLLLAIARDGESAAARIVAGAGADEESLRAAVARATA